MTAPSNASNGDQATAKHGIQREHGLSVLRDKEARALIGLATDAVRVCQRRS
jgi:hypothetical protein